MHSPGVGWADPPTWTWTDGVSRTCLQIEAVPVGEMLEIEDLFVKPDRMRQGTGRLKPPPSTRRWVLFKIERFKPNSARGTECTSMCALESMVTEGTLPAGSEGIATWA